MSKMQKITPITLNIVRGNNYIIKRIRGKLNGGVVTYPGMDKDNPIVWLGHPQYSVYNQQTKCYELFYNETRATLIKVDVGSSITSDTIVDLTRNFTIAVQNTKNNMNADKTNNDALKWALGAAILILLFAMIFAYLITTHNHGGTSVNTVNSIAKGAGAIIKIPR